MDRGVWWATVHRVAKSWTQLKWLSTDGFRDYLSEVRQRKTNILWYDLYVESIPRPEFNGIFGCNISLPNVKSIKVKKANPLHLESYLDILSQIGLTIAKNKDFIISSKEKPLKPVNIITTPYPGLPTDLAPIISIVLTQCKETSTLKDTVFPDRYSHVSEIQKLNANIQIFNNTLYIAKSNDPNKIKTNIMYAHDLRCAAALLLYAISVNEEIIIKDIDYLFRGYEEPIKKLQAIGITCSIIT